MNAILGHRRSTIQGKSYLNCSWVSSVPLATCLDSALK